MREKNTPHHKLIKNAVKSVTTFAKFIKLTGENTDDFVDLAVNVRGVLNTSAESIQRLVENFRGSLRKNNYEHNALSKYMDSAAVSLNKIANKQVIFSLQIQNVFVEPLQMFHQESYKHNVSIYQKLESLLKGLEVHERTLSEKKKGYYQYSSNAEKSQSRLEKVIEKFNDGSFSQKDLQREADRATKMKMLAEEARQEYQEILVSCSYPNQRKKRISSGSNFLSNFYPASQHLT